MLLYIVLCILFVTASPVPVAQQAHPFISLPLVRLHGGRDQLQTLGTVVVHKKHASHAARRLALMSSGPASPPGAVELFVMHQTTHARIQHHSITSKIVDSSGSLMGDMVGRDGTNSSSNYISSRRARPHSNSIHPSAHLDIEANDIGYLAQMIIGNAGQVFHMLVDAGSADMWVGGTGCRGDDGRGCGPHEFLGNSSSTFIDTGTAWYTGYGSGSVSGTIVSDHVRFAGFSLKHTFGVARNESRSFTGKDIPLDGVLGCAKSNLSMQGVPTLVESLRSAGLLDKNIISYKISRQSDGKDDGEITLGGMDPSKYDASTLVRVRNVNKFGFWAAKLGALEINGKAIKLSREKACVLDTGTTLIAVPNEDAALIHRSIPGAVFNSSLDSWTVPCQTNTSTTFYFGGRPFPIEPSDLAFLPVDSKNPRGACTSSIVGNSGGEDGTWLLGDAILKNVYLSTDQETDFLSIARLAR